MRVGGVPSTLVAIKGIGMVRPDGLASPFALPAGTGARECLAYQCIQRAVAECLPPAAVRKLDRLQLLMLAAAGLAVRDAGIQAGGPSVGVFAGTALGSLGATAEFLENMIRLEEREPKPAKFINSVHNAAASAVAIQLGCKGANHTITHDCVSLEMAFRRAVAALEAGRLKYAIVVGGDELNGHFVAVTRQLGWWRTASRPLSPLVDTGIRGSMPGEGAAAFVLEKPGRPADGPSAAAVRSMEIEPPARDGTGVDVIRECRFLQHVCDEAAASPAEIDLMLLGANGDEGVDARYRSVVEAFSAGVSGPMGLACFKQLCGEFCTASGIGLATAVDMVRSGRMPVEIQPIVPPRRPAICNVLVYNIYPNGYHSSFWVSR